MNKELYRSLCVKYTPTIREIPIPNISKHDATIKEAVFIDFRIVPNAEFVIRNAIIKLGPTWSHTIVCGNDNVFAMQQICRSISPNIRIIKFDCNNLNLAQYNLLLTSLEFWNALIGEKILIYQEDSCIFENNIDDFLQYDYIGAQFPTNIYSGTYVGNGGLSLRSKHIMIAVINKINILDTKLDIDIKDHYDIIPEDVYFCKNMFDYNIGNLADLFAANKFSVEHCYDKSILPFGGHCFWNSISNWENYVVTHCINH